MGQFAGAWGCAPRCSRCGRQQAMGLPEDDQVACLLYGACCTSPGARPRVRSTQGFFGGRSLRRAPRMMGGVSGSPGWRSSARRCGVVHPGECTASRGPAMMARFPALGGVWPNSASGAASHCDVCPATGRADGTCRSQVQLALRTCMERWDGKGHAGRKLAGHPDPACGAADAGGPRMRIWPGSAAGAPTGRPCSCPGRAGVGPGPRKR